MRRLRAPGAMEAMMFEVVDETSPAGASPPLWLNGGERVDLHGGRALELRSADGDLIFAYDPARRRTVVNIPEGDLLLNTQRGDIALSAAGRLRLEGEQAVEVSGGTEVTLSAGEAVAGERSAVELGPERLRLSGANVSLLGDRGEASFRRFDFGGERWTGTVEEAKLVFGRLQTVSDHVQLKAKEVFQTVEGLLQTRAGRARSLFRDAYHLKGRDLFLRAEKNAALDGEQVLLG